MYKLRFTFWDGSKKMSFLKQKQKQLKREILIEIVATTVSLKKEISSQLINTIKRLDYV